MTHFEIWTLELNQIAQGERQYLVAGGKIQSGEFHTRDEVLLSSSATNLQQIFNNPPAAGDTRDHFERLSAYGYYTRELFANFSLTAGLSYERMIFPTDFRSPPQTAGTTTRGQLNPKAALVWSPVKEITLRSIYARSLSGVSDEQSFRLEPTQLAGFVQSLGSTIPESVAGAVSAADSETYGGAVDVKLRTSTYFGVQVQVLNTSVDQQQGAFFFGGVPPAVPGTTRETLDYSETALSATLNQLVSDQWSLGLSYRFTDAGLHTVFPALVPITASANSTQSANLHALSAFVLFNHPSGFFALAENNWYHQDNDGYTPALMSSDFSQQNLVLGWRLKRQRGEISFGILNLSDQDYHLNPLTVYNELPRARTYVGRVKFNF